MPGQYRIKRRVALLNISQAEGSSITVDMPRGYDLESVYFFMTLAGTLTTAGTAVRAEAPLQMIRRIELVADGKNTIASVSGSLLNRTNLQRNGQLGFLSAPADATAAARTASAALVLDQQLIDGIRPKDSNLRTSGMQLLQLRITFGNWSDCFTGAAAGGLTANSTIDITTSETVELPDEQGNISRPLYVLKRTFQDVSCPSTNANQEINLPVGNFLKAVALRAQGATTAGEPSDAVVNFITLRSGVDVRFSASWNQTVAMIRQDYNVTTRPVGVAVADMTNSGSCSGVRATDAWDLTRASECKLVLDVNGGANNQVGIMTTELVQ
jgi:hypothetical protein